MSVRRKCPALGAQLPNSMQVYFPTAQVPIYLRPFFTKLADEVKKAVPHGKMIVLTEFESTDRKQKFSFVPYPEDVFRELGLSVQA
jgi:hypothetical protein